MVYDAQCAVGIVGWEVNRHSPRACAAIVIQNLRALIDYGKDCKAISSHRVRQSFAKSSDAHEGVDGRSILTSLDYRTPDKRASLG